MNDSAIGFMCRGMQWMGNCSTIKGMDHQKIKVKSFTLSQWQTNCYVIHTVGGEDGEGCSEGWIIDCGFEPGELIGYLRAHRIEPTRLILTHGHLDHIGGIGELREAYPGIPILIHRNEADFLTDPTQNLGAFYEMDLVMPRATGFLKEDDCLELGGVTFYVLETPGHSPGSISLYSPVLELAIVGDTLMKGSMGRSDFPHSDSQLLYRMIKDKLLALPGQTTVLSGHGSATTVRAENEHNPFFDEVR